MKSSKVLCLILGVLMMSTAQADYAEELIREPASSDETIVDESYLQETDWSEPLFASQGIQRDVARTLEDSDDEIENEWAGHLSVQAEIPFTYPVMTRHSIQKKTLIEIETQASQ